ncbi:MAG: VOC family protein [Rhodospirillales bacterium]
MSDNHGRFVWYELLTTDPAAAAAFYSHVVGWTTEAMSVPGIDMPYTMFKRGDAPVCGLMAQPPEARSAGAPPAWLGYVGVDDVDAAAAHAKDLGGAWLMPPMDIPTVGRFAVVADPQGAALGVFRYTCENPPPAPEMMATGTVGWHELVTDGWQKAFDHYAARFGWTKAEAMDMGPMGTYQLFAAGAHPIGGMMNRPPGVPASFWLYYFVVDDIDAAIARLGERGGQVVNGPMEVPGGAWIVQALDPQGALFALVGQRRAAG